MNKSATKSKTFENKNIYQRLYTYSYDYCQGCRFI